MTTPAILALFSLGGWEIVVIALVALVLFAHRIPSAMRSVGRGIMEFKRGLKDSRDEIQGPKS